MDRALAPLGLTSAQYALLASLYGLARAGARPSQRELADFAGLEPMSVSKLARGLERAGLLARAASSADPRAVELTLTPDGVDTVTTAVATVRELHGRLLAPLGGTRGARHAEFAATLKTLLDHVTAVNNTRPAPETTPTTAAPGRRR